MATNCNRVASRKSVCYTIGMLELLAPAGDMQAFETAINCGADAVYLGLDNFNARMKARNFSSDNLADVVERAHFYGVKVYVTVNTILQNQEFNELISLVKSAVSAKVDAFLVQDLGVVKVLKDCFPGIVLHASTQMGVHNLYGAKVAERAGVKRVVLSRETKLQDIKDIRKNTDLEIEYFVQGALCIAFSGNCYLSSVEQGASGNRGLCKQMCRLCYNAKAGRDESKGYLLSAKDLCLAKSVKELADAGVCSFKIEGRLRREGYVATAVSLYRKALDFAQDGEEYVPDKDEMRGIKIAYSRGEYLERAYLDKEKPFAVEKRFNNHTGVEIGTVKSVKEFKDGLFEIAICSDKELCKGDGLKFFDNDREKASLGVGQATRVAKNVYSVVSKTKVKPGWKVNLILDAERDAIALSKKRTVPVMMSVSAKEGKPLCIRAICDLRGTRLQVEKYADSPLEKAKNAPTSAQDIAGACSKTADSGFAVLKCDVDCDDVFVARSVVNALRRDALACLKEEIVRFNAPGQVEIRQDKIEEYLSQKFERVREEKTFVARGNEFGDFARKGWKTVVYPNEYTIDCLDGMLEQYDLEQSEIALGLPVIANGKDVEKIEKLLADAPCVKTLVSHNIYGLYFADKGYDVVAGQGHNVANGYAVLFAKELGAKGYEPSMEYKDFPAPDCLARYSPSKDIALMTFAHCPYKTLYGNDCGACKYKGDLSLSREKHSYVVKRVRVADCYFGLYPARD